MKGERGQGEFPIGAANEQTVFGGATLTYDQNGNLTNDGVNTYQWDARNRLIGLSGGSTASFAYDPLGRRVSKTINGVSTQFAYDGDDITAEIDSGAVGSTYLRSLNIDEVFGFLRQDGVYFSIYDGIGSTLALTNQSGSPAVQYTYEPFGKTQSSSPAFANPFQFTGRESDGTGLAYYRARYYSPILGRFISEDPSEFGGGDTNLYVYGFNNPLLFTDPSGEIAPLLLICLREAAISVAQDSLAGRKLDYSDAVGACLTGGLSKAKNIKKLAQKGKKRKGEPKGHPRGEDKPVRDIEKEFKMTEKERERFKQARDDFKEQTSRGPSDNLSYEQLRQIANEVKNQ